MTPAEYEALVRKLVAAMKRSVRDGCTDHLDICDDGGAFWHEAIAEAERLVGEVLP